MVVRILLEPLTQYLETGGWGSLRETEGRLGSDIMADEQYDAGEEVPIEIRSAPEGAGEDEIRFAVPVEIYGGFGSAKHVYPTEEIESTADLFTADGVTTESLVTGDVRLYTVPHEMLR